MHIRIGNPRVKESNNVAQEIVKLKGLEQKGENLGKLATSFIELVKQDSSKMEDLYSVLTDMQDVADETFNASISLQITFCRVIHQPPPTCLPYCLTA